MRLSLQFPPHIRSKDTNLSMMLDVIIAMVPVYMMSVYFYGWRAIHLMSISVLTCFTCDILCVIIAKRIPNIRDLSSVITGMLVPLLLPASISLEILIVAGIFATIVAKHPFGGLGENVFNPAAAGVAFAMVCWPNAVFSYVMPFESLPITIVEPLRIMQSPAKALSLGGVPTVDFIDMFLGNFAGPMGATNILLLLTCLLYLVVKKTISFSMTSSYLLGAAIVAMFLPRADMTAMESLLYEMMSGYMLIGGVFLINDPVTSPKRAVPKIIYGFITGVVGMGFRHIGRYEESLLFAILVMNALVWILDLLGEHIAHYYRRKESEYKRSQEVQNIDEKDTADI